MINNYVIKIDEKYYAGIDEEYNSEYSCLKLEDKIINAKIITGNINLISKLNLILGRIDKGFEYIKIINIFEKLEIKKNE